MKIPNKPITIAHPTKPNSSANTAKIKSVCGSDMYKYFCLLWPNPTPNNPPEPIAYKLCITCHPSPCLSALGFFLVVFVGFVFGGFVVFFGFG